MVRDNYTLLINKLDDFIRKYYVNQLLRGSLYAVGLILALFILFNVMEYYFYFGSSVRKGMFYSFLLATGVALYQWVAIPLLHYFHLGHVISHEQAATIIGNHFTDVKDKLLNILQLRQQSGNALYADLIHASIQQKSESIKLVPFKSAIDLGSNRKYLKYTLPPLLLLLFLLFGAPNILKEGTKRLINNGMVFEKPAPFSFKISVDSLTAVQFSDYVLHVDIDGAVLPNEAFIDLGGKLQYRLTKESPTKFTYTFVNVQQDTEFKLYAGGVESKPYKLNVLKKPGIVSFDVKLNFPSYIGRASESLANIGDLVVPQGTQISWVFQAQNTDNLRLNFAADPSNQANRIDNSLFSYQRKAYKDEAYKVFISNRAVPNGDSVGYSISVVPDLAPQISVQEFKDTLNTNMLFFAGEASDDYGLQNITFNYQIKKEKGGQLPLQTTPLTKPGAKQVNYDYKWNVKDIDLNPGDEISYYFETFDNDGVNGSKSARTPVMNYRLPSTSEMEKKVEDNTQEIKEDLKNALKESKKIQDELKKLREKVLQQKEMDWQTKKEMQKLLDRQKELNEMLQQAQQKFEENKQSNEEMNKLSPELLEKQEKLEQMFKETLNPEMQKLMEEIQKLLEEMNKDQALEKMEKMNLSNEELSKQMDKLEELYKKLEVENMLEKQIEKLEELAQKQEELAKKTEEKSENQEQLKKEQDELKKEMDELQKKQEELEKKNDALERKKDIPEEAKEEMDDAEKDMDDAKKDMEKQDNAGAGKKQKKAAKKMKDTAAKMKSKMKSGDSEAMEEDIATLRQILENLVGLSFNQEKNMKEVTQTRINTPRYVSLAQEQYKIKDDFKIVEDSLQALAKRNFKIEGIVNEKVAVVKSSIKKSLEELEERHVPQGNEQQQRSMTGMNDLALLLSEILNNMQQEASAMPGDGSCDKPGKGKGKGKGDKPGKVPGDKMSKGQGDLNQQMKDLKERLEKQGKGAPGQQGGPTSKEFAQMAAKQAALRNALKELQKEKQQQGKGSKMLDEIMGEMDKVETDLVNKRLTNEAMKRQQDILTRLLEEERAERERKQDEKRQAEKAQQQPAKVPPAMEEYLKKRQAEIELFKNVSPALKPYYKSLVEEYFKAAGGK